MRWLGYKRLSVKSIVLDVPDIRKRMKAPHVAELAKDEEDSGKEYIHAPTIRGEDRRLICGRDRMAGALLNKRKSIWFHVVDCTDKEAAELEEKENIYRRHSEGERAASLARLVALQEQKLRSERDASIGDNVADAGTASKPPKSDKTIKIEARRAVARAAGITPKSVKQAEARAAAAETQLAEPELTEEEANAGGKIELPPKFNTFDLDLPLASRSVISETAVWLGDWAQTINGMLRELTELDKQGTYAVAPAHIQKIRDAFQGAGHAVREAIPASLCFYCKAQPAATPNCSACGGTGVVGRHGGDNVPPEAKLVGDKARCAVGGKWVLVGAAANAAEATSPRRSRGASA